ncbi:MAG: hypothetical protein ABIH24_05845 [Verrucomicrobiota bacterium]
MGKELWGRKILSKKICEGKNGAEITGRGKHYGLMPESPFVFEGAFLPIRTAVKPEHDSLIKT